MFEHDHKTLKYALPGALAILFGTGAWYCTLEWLTVVLGLFTGLCVLIALTNLWRVISDHRLELWKEHQAALSVTPLVLLAQAMKQMHPEAVKVLNRFGVRTSWQVRVSANMGSRDWVLADTNVHFGFIEYVLSNSNGTLYPKWRFSEGSRKWDPDGLVTDREQYEEFEKWLFARLMVTRAHGEFKPPEFIPPWTPELIMETMGMTGEQDLYYPDETTKVSKGDATEKELPEFIEKTLEDLQTTKIMNAK
jgi:hypothetical protein